MFRRRGTSQLWCGRKQTSFKCRSYCINATGRYSKQARYIIGSMSGYQIYNHWCTKADHNSTLIGLWRCWRLFWPLFWHTTKPWCTNGITVFVNVSMSFKQRERPLTDRKPYICFILEVYNNYRIIKRTDKAKPMTISVMSASLREPFYCPHEVCLFLPLSQHHKTTKQEENKMNFSRYLIVN